MISFFPSVVWASITSSPFPTEIAMIPLLRGFAYAESGVFFTIPFPVTNIT